jgi:hypothetical protein
MDVTGRTESDPAAARLARNILEYACNWKPARRRSAAYIGDAGGKAHLESAGVSAAIYDGGRLLPDQVLVVGPGGGQSLTGRASAVTDWLNAGGNLLAIGIDQSDADILLPFKVSMKTAEHISTFFEPFAGNSLLAGVSPADVHNRDPRDLSLLSEGVQVFGNGVLAKGDRASVVFFQLAPWHFDGSKQSNLRRTQRRASYVVSRLLANMGVASSTPLLARFHVPPDIARTENRWLEGFYLDQPEEWDDPYRFFRW